MPSAGEIEAAKPRAAVGGHHPLHREVGEIGERVAERRQLPVEHRGQCAVAVEHDIVDAIVAMDDRGPRLLGQGFGQERDQPLHLRDIVGLRVRGTGGSSA